MKLSKTKLSKIEQTVGFLVRLLGSFLKAGLRLMKNLLKLLAISVLIPLGLKEVASATDAASQKKTFGSGCLGDLTPRMTVLTVSNEEMDDMKIVNYLESAGLLRKGVRETIKNEAKEQKGGFLGTLLGTLGASLLGNLLTGKEVKQSKILLSETSATRAKIPGRGVMRAGEGIIRAVDGIIIVGQDF